MNNRVTPEKVNHLNPGEIFVFGSNEAGTHGAGAAKWAKINFGACSGMGFGLQGRSFAIPTKNQWIMPMSISMIVMYVDRFIDFAIRHPKMTFLVTEIGCGLAGNLPKDIAPLFKNAIELENVHLPQRFWDVLNKIS